MQPGFGKGHPGLTMAIWESPSPGYHRADVSLSDSEATPLHPGLSGSTRDCSGCPPGVEKGCGWAACQHLGSTGVAWESTNTTPGATTGTQGQTKVYPGYAEVTPSNRQGHTTATPG